MDILARTRPDLILRLRASVPDWARTADAHRAKSLHIVAAPSQTSVYLWFLDARGERLSETWHEGLSEALEAATKEFHLTERDFVFVPGRS